METKQKMSTILGVCDKFKANRASAKQQAKARTKAKPVSVADHAGLEMFDKEKYRGEAVYFPMRKTIEI